jgi:hypothetical protein
MMKAPEQKDTIDDADCKAEAPLIRGEQAA